MVSEAGESCIDSSEHYGCKRLIRGAVEKTTRSREETEKHIAVSAVRDFMKAQIFLEWGLEGK